MKRCLYCAKDIDDAVTICPHCGNDPAQLPSRDRPYAVAKADALPVTRVTVVDFDMPFGSMVMVMTKWALATIPALLILGLIGFMVFVFLAAIGSSLAGV